MSNWKRLAGVVAALLVVVPAIPVPAANGCRTRVNLSQERQSPPLAEPRSYQPVNGTGGFSVFGANTLPAGVLSVGIGYLGEEAACQQLDDIFDYHTLFVPIAFGITSRLQVGVDLPYSWYEADRAGFEGSGIDDVNFGVVYRFLDEGPGRPALAIVGFAAAPTGERSEGLGTNEWNLGAKLALSKTLPGGLLGHANIGYTYVGRGAVDEDDEFNSGVALELPLGKHFSVVGEGLASTNRREGRENDWVAETRAGFRVRFAGFLLSVAGRKGLTNDAPDWGVFALLTYQTPPLFRAAAAPVPGPVAAPPAAPVPGAPTPAAPAPAAPAAPAPAAPAAPAPAAPTAPAVPGPPGPPAVPPGPPVAAPPGPPAAPPGPPVAAPPGPPVAAPPGPPVAAPPGPPAAPGVPAAPGAPAAPAVPGAPPTAPGVATVPPTAIPAPGRAMLRDVNFEFDRYDLTDAAKRFLDDLAQALKASPGFNVLVEGHADERGTTEYNLALGQRRAQAAKDYLVSLGIAPDRIDTISYGEERPLDPAHDELAWALNRRAHFVVRTGR